MMNQQWIETFRGEIREFSDKLDAYTQGEVDKKAYKGFSGGFGSYAQRDPARHMLRLRMAGGRLTRERLAFLADAASSFGVQRMKLTTCESVQLHDLAAEKVPALMEAAIDCAIYTRGGGGDHARNVMCSPLSGVQPGEAFDVMPWAEAATQYMLSICRDIRMPRKLKIAFCNGVDDSVHSAFRDMGFVAQPDGTFKLYIAGGLGASNPCMGVQVADAIPAGEILYYLRAMVDVFCAHGNYENRAKARTRFLQETLGAEGLKERFLAHVAARKAEGGLELALQPSPVCKTGAGSLEDARVIPQKQPGLYAVKYHPIGGCLPVDKPAELLAAMADMPEVECRVAPDETLYIINLTADEAKTMLAVTQDGAVTEFEHSVACIGATVCQQGVRDSQSALLAVVETVRAAGLPDGALPRIAISGCPSSCGAHQSAAIGFQGGVRLVDRTPQPAYRMLLGGSDALGGAAFGEPIATVLEKDLPELLVKLGTAAAEAGMRWEQWAPENRDAISAIVAAYA